MRNPSGIPDFKSGSIKKAVTVLVFLLACSVAAQQKKPAPAPAPTAPATAPAPALTLEQLQQRLAELQRERDQAIADLNVLIGRINECNDMIEALKPKPQETDAKPKPK